MRSPRSSLARRQAAACTYGASACASPTRKRAGADLRPAFQWRIGSKLSGEAANSCVYPTVAVSNRALLPCGFLSLQDASPTIGKAEAYPSSIAVSCCAWALHFGGDPRLQLSALCFMQECETRPCRAVADARIFPHYRTSTINSPSWLSQERHRDVPGWDTHRSPRADSFIAQDAMPALPIELALVSFV